MINIKLTASSKLINKKLNLRLLSNLLSLVINEVRPFYPRNTTLKLRIITIPGDTCYAVFKIKQIQIGKNILHTYCHELINYLMHEVFHFVQHYIDNVPIKLFAIDNLAQTDYKSYKTNPTEVQAWKFDSLSKRVFKLYKDINALNRCIQKNADIFLPIN